MKTVFFLRNFGIYFLLLFPISSSSLLLALRLDGYLSTLSFLVILAPLLFQQIALLCYVLNSVAGSAFVAAFLGCVVSVQSRIFCTVIAILSSTLISGDLLLIAFYLDNIGGLGGLIGLYASFSVFFLLDVSVAATSLCWVHQAESDDKCFPWVLLILLCPISAFHVVLFHVLYSDMDLQSESLPVWSLFIPLLAMDVFLWISPCVKSDLHYWLNSRSFLPCLGFKHRNYWRIVSSLGSLIYIGFVMLKCISIRNNTGNNSDLNGTAFNSIPWTFTCLPLWISSIFFLFDSLLFLIHRIRKSTKSSWITMKNFGEPNRKLVTHQERTLNEESENAFCTEGLLASLCYSLPFLSGTVFFTLLSSRIDGYITWNYTLVFIPIFFTILVMIIFNNRSSSNFTPLFFLIGCYSSVDEIVPTRKVRFLFRTFYNLSACIVLAILVLLSLQFDKKISLEWSTYFIFSGFLIALSFSLLSILFIGSYL